MSNGASAAEEQASSKSGRKSFVDLSVGQVFKATERIRWWNIFLAALATGDFNPLHWNPFFARRHELKGIIAHGILTTGVISKAFGSSLFVPGVKVLNINIEFKRPVYAGDKVSLVMEVKEIRFADLPMVRFNVAVVNPNVKVVCQGTVLVAVPY